MPDTDNSPAQPSTKERLDRAIHEFRRDISYNAADAAYALDRKIERLNRVSAPHEFEAREAARDNAAVDDLATAMKDKLARKRSEGRHGWWWEGCTTAMLSVQLRNCVEKGDPVDVANYCAFLFAKTALVERHSKAPPKPVDESGQSAGFEAGPTTQAETNKRLVAAAEFAGELNRARKKFPPMASAHEGLAIILEELDELKAIVWQKQDERNYAELRKETIQLGAMVLAFLEEVVAPVNRR